MSVKCVVFIFLRVICEINSSRILCVFPIPSVSHQIVFRAYTEALIAKGHELVIVTPNPVYGKDNVPPNVKEIDTSYTYPILQNVLKNQDTVRGVVVPYSHIKYENYAVFMEIMNLTFANPEFKTIIENKNQKFDLIVTEAPFNVPVYLKYIFNAPHIWLSSMYGDKSIYDSMGAPAWQPFIYPDFIRNKIYNLSVLDKLGEIFKLICLLPTVFKLIDVERKLVRDIFNDYETTLESLSRSTDLVLLNSNPIFNANRPVPTNIVFLGGLHLKPVKNLPNELKTYMDSSERGVIYVSLGTNVFTEKITADLLEVFLKAFEALPYDVLWKFNAELENKPDNLRIEKWFPQRDLLNHPKIKVFVTQGGMQSTDEGIDAAVPFVGIPMFADQWFNVEQYVRLGIGVQLDAITMTAKDLEVAIRKVIDEPSYRENIVRLRTLINDQPQSPLERAVWWTEYVIRHKGAKHLRSPMANISWAEYYEFELLKFIALYVFAFMLCITLVTCFLWLCIKNCCNKYEKNIIKKKTN